MPPPGALIRIKLASNEPEALSELLLGIGACSAAMQPAGNSDCNEVMRATPDEKVPLWRQSEVTALFPVDTDLAKVADLVHIAMDLAEVPELEPEVVEDKDWVSHVQKNWKPLLLGSRFEVRLPWHDGPAGGCSGPDGRVVLRLEGGVAFGLGDHATTQGATAFVERTVPAMGECRVLDYGTGSGILAVCAAFLGARRAVGVDVDAPSVASAKRSAALNLLQGHALRCVEFLEGPADFSGATVFAESLGQFDVVVANILRRPLVALAPALAAATRSGGALGLTGLRSDLGDFHEIQSGYDFAFEGFRKIELDGGWMLVEATRK